MNPQLDSACNDGKIYKKQQHILAINLFSLHVTESKIKQLFVSIFIQKLLVQTNRFGFARCSPFVSPNIHSTHSLLIPFFHQTTKRLKRRSFVIRIGGERPIVFAIHCIKRRDMESFVPLCRHEFCCFVALQIKKWQNVTMRLEPWRVVNFDDNRLYFAQTFVKTVKYGNGIKIIAKLRWHCQ